MELAAEEGHLDVVKWLHNNRNEGCTSNAIDYASKYGYISIVNFYVTIEKKDSLKMLLSGLVEKDIMLYHIFYIQIKI